MKRKLALALGALALGWWTSSAAASDPAASGPLVIQPPPARGGSGPAPGGQPAPGMMATPADKSILPSGELYCMDCGMCSMCGGGFVAGIGFYYLQPRWESNPAFIVTIGQQVGPDLVLSRYVEDFSYDHEFAPRIWIGFVADDGLGVRARYWSFDADSSAFGFNPVGFEGAVIIESPDVLGIGSIPGQNDTDYLLAANSNIELDVWDLEVTQTLDVKSWVLLGSAGLRYARIAQDYQAAVTRNFLAGNGAPGDVDVVSGGHNFYGVGPTVAVEARRPLGLGFTLYSSARGSLLFGTGKRVAGRSLAGMDARFFESEVSSRDDFLPIGELEIGAEWATDLGWSRLFVQGAYVGQIWCGAGSPTSESDNLAFSGFSFVIGAQR